MFAWMTLQSETDVEEAEARVQDALYTHLSNHVAFHVPEERLERLGPTWWRHALDHALQQFLHANELTARIQHHVRVMQSQRWPQMDS